MPLRARIRLCAAMIIVAISGFWQHSAAQDPESFARALASRMPSGMEMPRIFAESLEWLEVNGYRFSSRDGEPVSFERQFLALYAAEEFEKPGASAVVFQHYGRFALGPNKTVVADEDERVFLFLRTGADGSYAGFWIDESGKQWVVHYGSGSGSSWWGVISDNPAALLQLIAIGYSEPAYTTYHSQTSSEAGLAFMGVGSLRELAQLIAENRVVSADSLNDFQSQRDELAQKIEIDLANGAHIDDNYFLPRPPHALQAYLKRAHGLETPCRAVDIPGFRKTGEKDDPFVAWLEEVTPQPTTKELELIRKLEALTIQLETEARALEKRASDLAE